MDTTVEISEATWMLLCSQLVMDWHPLFHSLYIRSFPFCPSLCPRFNIVSRLSIGLQIKRTLFASETQP
ncbi:hypothetical protein NC651_020253 [Populus alba x Populus x berolinensis]|nr:hypothetical protein NC651_020253 [Populus alba x Populus x berolinensis]